MATSKNKMRVQSSVCNMQEDIHASRNWTHPCMCANADTTFSEIPSQLMQGCLFPSSICQMHKRMEWGFQGAYDSPPRRHPRSEPVGHSTLRHHCIPHRLLSPLRGLMSNSESATGQNLRRMLLLHYASFFFPFSLRGRNGATWSAASTHLQSGLVVLRISCQELWYSQEARHWNECAWHGPKLGKRT